MPSMTYYGLVAAHGALVAAALLFSHAGHAATVLLSNPDGALRAAKVRDNYVVVGVVGDYVDLKQGEHKLRIDAPRAYTLVIDLLVEENAVSITGSRTEPGNCKPNFETTWDAPRIVSHGKKKSRKQKSHRGEATEPSPEMPAAVTTLEVSGPQFGQASNRGSCSQPSMLGCTKKFTIVAVDSVPPGAEIWVDNESTDVTTKGTLSVPYCPGRERTKQILVRMPGRVTCPRDVPMAEGIRAEVMCELALPR